MAVNSFSQEIQLIYWTLEPRLIYLDLGSHTGARDQGAVISDSLREVVGHVPLFQINECGINRSGFLFVTACLSTHHAIWIALFKRNLAVNS